jgi:hypothetical protein
MMRNIFCVFLLLLITCISTAQPATDRLLRKILTTGNDPLLLKIINDPATYRLQIIYTQINRDRNNRPSFKNYFYNYDPGLYFNPASMVKMPVTFLSLEKLNTLKEKGIDKYTTIQFDSSQPWQTAMYKDSSASSRLPSIAHLIKRALLISENDPYNRMYQFIGQGPINRSLHDKGYKDVRITRQFLGLTAEQNRYTNAVRFIDDNGKLLYAQPPQYNIDSFDFSSEIKVGKAHLNRNDSLINEPFDFTRQNNISLLSMQQMLQSVMFPASLDSSRRFALTADDYKFLYRYLSQYPSETPDPKYDTTEFYDSYVKFFFRDSTRHMPESVRVFNKVGWSYGFLTDVSYVADFNNKVEFMLSATVYVNSDEVLNDNKYEYVSVGHPFLYSLGQTIYNYELKRKRKHAPDLSAFKITYEKRDPNDTRPSLKEVDN